MTDKEQILADMTSDYLFITDKSGHILWQNQAADNFLTYADLSDILTDAENNLFCRYMQKSLASGQEQSFYMPLASGYYEVRIKSNEENFCFALKDITAQKKLEHRLSETLERLNFASKIAKIGYWELDLTERKISWSSEMFRIFGISSHDLSVKKNIIREQMYKEDLPKYKDKLRKIMKTGQPEEGIVRIIRPDNKLIYCRYKADYMDYGRNHKKIMGTFQDLTELLEIQHALEKSKELAEHLNHEKTYLLAQASHDLQQPVSAMNMFIDSLLNADLSGKQQILVGKIYDSAQSIHALLNNLLDISNLENKGVRVKKTTFNLQNLLNRIEKDISAIIEAEAIKLKMINCNKLLHTDEVLLERILRNYISNAIKYTKDKIIIGCRLQRKHLRIIVADNGIGIRPKDIKNIFEPYYQGRKSAQDRRRGSGLGLAIVKKTADLMRVEVGVKSKFRHGSQFYIDLPRTN